MYCHAQCNTRDILDAIGLCMDDMFDEPRQRDEPRFTRRAVTPATDADMAARVIVRALRVAMGRDLGVWQDKPGVAEVPWQERVRRAEDGCRQDAEAHYWRTLGRWSALACDRAYVQQAYASKAAYEAREPDAQLTHEQAAVLVIRAEDLVTGDEVAA